MTESTAVYSWDSLDVDEYITPTDHAVSNNLDIQTPVGAFLVSVLECTPIEKNFDKYSCMAAKLKMRIEAVLKIEQPLVDSKGQQIKRDGVLIQKVQDIPVNKRDGINALYTGRFIFDEINLYNIKEKEAMKNRRLFVAKKLGLITEQSTVLNTAMWAGAVGRKAIVITEWNSWQDKLTKETKKNVKVGWSGYDFAGNVAVYAPDMKDASFSSGAGNTQPADDDFSNI